MTNGEKKGIGWRGRYPILPEDPTIRRIEEELRFEQEGESAARSRFPVRYPRISAVPVVGTVARVSYSFGFTPLLALFAILVLFTAIKAPYFGLPFTGEHSMKYNAYVEPAMHMAEKNDITWYQLKYQSNPVRNPGGIFKEFGHIPLYEWGLFAVYKILPSGSIETNTRIFTHGIGILILLSGYIFFRRWVPTKLALLTVLLMAINPIISFATFVTVLDSLAILFMFVSLILLNGYLESGNLSRLYWAGILFGIGNCVKYSMFLWVAPIGLLLLYYRRENRVGYLRDFGIYLFLGVFCIVAHLTSLSKLPGAPGKAVILSIVWVLAFFLIYEGIRKYRSWLDGIIKRITDSKVLLLLSLLVLLAAGIGILMLTRLSTFIDTFLTDASLFFNPRVYAHMFRIQFKAYSTQTIFWLGIAGLGILFSARGGDLKKVASAFLLGSVVYWVVASKAMFIHNYYTIIIMIAFSLLAATTMYYLLMQISSARIKWILILLFLVLIFPRAYEANTNRLGQKQDISEAIQFIMEHTDENDLILNESVLAPITIYTGRGLIFPRVLRNSTIREDIQKIGFAETMKKYRIKYLFTPNEKPLYIDFAPIFTDTSVREPRFDRKHYIYNEIGERNRDMEKGYQELEDIVKRYRIDEKFKEEAKTGKFRFYSFVN